MSDSKDTILMRLLSYISDIYDKTVGSFFYDIQKAVAIELESAYKKISDILDNGFVRTATGEYLIMKVEEQGITPKNGKHAAGVVEIIGEPGAVITAGDKVASDNMLFSVTESAIIPPLGNLEISVVADEEGFAGNVPAGAVKRFPVTISGLFGVSNAMPMSGGYDKESEEELRQRFFDKVKAPATSGNESHYAFWAKEVAGVGGAKVTRCWDGPGTVKVIIIASDKQAADTGLITEVYQYIEENRPVGAEVIVESAAIKSINVAFGITLEQDAVREDAETAVIDSLAEYLSSIAWIEDYVSYAGIGFAIKSSQGVKDYKNLKVNGGTVNIDIADEEVPVLGTVTVS